MKRKLLFILVLALMAAFLLTACKGSADPSDELASLRSKVKELESQNKDLQKQLDKLVKPKANEVDSKKADLDGDGAAETVTLKIDEKKSYFELTVNNMIISGKGDNLNENLEIVDFDKSDSSKEIAISQTGSVSEAHVYYYKYTSDGIIFVGKVIGTPESVTYNGNGSISAIARGDLTDGWYYISAFNIEDNSLIPEQPTSEIFSMKSKAVVLKPITVDIEGSSSNMTLIKGEVLTFVQSDNKSEVLADTLTGLQFRVFFDETGTIKGTEYKMSDVFETSINY
ncbi:MAG: hypothetical protein PHV32_03045 [Eubacteriales bacterium]|nr:hypothetical protein [Eubacteriales bacterium]